jgi:hypothetical protein
MASSIDEIISSKCHDLFKKITTTQKMKKTKKNESPMKIQDGYPSLSS